MKSGTNDSRNFFQLAGHFGGVPIQTQVNIFLAALSLFVSVLFFYPGHVPFDGILVWYEARHAIHQSQDPPAMAFILHYLDILVPGPGLYTVLQLGLLDAAAFFVVRALTPPAAVAACFYVFIVLFPPLMAMEGLLIKDILSAHLCVLAFVVLMAPPRDGDSILSRSLAAYVMIAVATMLRYQFIVLLLPLSFLLLVRSRSIDRKRFVRVILISVCGFLMTVAAINFEISRTFKMMSTPALDRNIGANDFERSVRKILIYDIAGVVVYHPSSDLKVLADAGVDTSDLRSRIGHLYSAYHVDTMWVPGGVFSQLRSMPMKTLERQWLLSLRTSPVAFAKHHVMTFARVLGIGNIYECFPVVSGIYQIPRDKALDLHAESFKAPLSTQVLRSRYLPVVPTFPPTLYLGLGIGLIGFFGIGRAVPLDAAVLCSAGILYELTFFALPQSCDVRYSYFMILSAIFGAAMTIFRGLEPKDG